MSTTAISAGQLMDRVANLLNDPQRTDYNYAVQIPYLNMAIEELSELLEESNSSPSQNITSIIVQVGQNYIGQIEDTNPNAARYPDDLTEIQEVGERPVGSQAAFNRLPRVETQKIYPITNSLCCWWWENQQIKFNTYGANVPLEVQLIYLRQGVPYVANENSPILMINSRSYLAFKTAALIALFIGENETRAGVLQAQAEKAADRLINISSKGRQQIVTRHRPFRAAYKSRGGW